MKNYQLLGREWDYYIPLPEFLERLSQHDAMHSASKSVVNKKEQLREKLSYPVLQHLGFGPIDGVAEQVARGVDLAVVYFTSGGHSSYHRSYPWFDALTSGLFLGGLAGRWEDLGRICSRLDASIDPEYTAGMIEDEYQQLFLCIASSLRPEPMEGVKELLAKVKNCRARRPRLLCAAWEAAIAGDQAAFNKAFPETVKHFLSQREGGPIYDWVAIDQSTVWLVAQWRGLAFPPLPDKLAAAVVTRRSAGVEVES